MGASEIIGLLGGIALFLFGMAIMGDGLKKVAGSKLELVLYKLTSTPLKGVLLGTGVTAVIQSSSATSVMVVGFVNSGMMKVNQAIGIVMGAILGTSVTGWILCLSSLSGGSGWVTLLSTRSAPFRTAISARANLFTAANSPRWVKQPLMAHTTGPCRCSCSSIHRCPRWKGSYSQITPKTGMRSPLPRKLQIVTNWLQFCDSLPGILYRL